MENRHQFFRRQRFRFALETEFGDRRRERDIVLPRDASDFISVKCAQDTGSRRGSDDRRRIEPGERRIHGSQIVAGDVWASDYMASGERASCD